LGEPAEIGVLTRAELGAVTWMSGDVRDGRQIEESLEGRTTDVVYHLAGATHVPSAGSDPVATYEVNTIGVVRLIGAIAKMWKGIEKKPRVMVIGSGEQYGAHPERELPLLETATQSPLTVYAASKAAQEILALQAGRENGIEVIATRSFNHSGPGQDSRFLLPGLVERIRILAQNGGSQFPIGNTAPVRDFLHVRDVVAAYIGLADKGEAGAAYNVSSGKGWAVGEIVQLVLEIGKVEAAPVPDPALVRRVDVERLIGDNRKLATRTGWRPHRTLHDVIRDLWAHSSSKRSSDS
jgi:GDP-4-dehydro-6-deoxy-D-mannose reductase